MTPNSSPKPPDSLPISKVSIMEPEDNSSDTKTPSTTDCDSKDELKIATVTLQITPTITEEDGDNAADDKDVNKKSCLSLPVEPMNGITPPAVHDRRKLSVQGLMGFGERRRSSGAFLTDLTRKMSISNGDGFGETGFSSSNNVGHIPNVAHFWSFCIYSLFTCAFEALTKKVKFQLSFQDHLPL